MIAAIVLVIYPGTLTAKPRTADGGAAITRPAVYTPPSPPPGYFDYFNDNYFSMGNRSANTASLIVTNAGATQATSANTAYQQQYEVLLNLEDGTYRLRNRDTGLCVGALNGSTAVGTSVAAVAYTGDSSQRWYLTGTGGGYWDFVNVANGLAMQTDGGSPAKVTLQPVNTASTQQQWLADPTHPVDHYPKKGQAGYPEQFARWGGSWVYNWGATTGQPVPFNETDIAMQYGPYWPNTNDLGGGYNALHSTAKPEYILGFNEPDQQGQGTGTTDDAMNIWPALTALNEPLVSPACASTYGGWLGDFYSKAQSHGYRVDYTGVHAYTQDTSVDDYFGYLDGIASNWNHSIWVTEFGLTTWGASGYSWSEEDMWTFFAEFMWRAEDDGNLRRYSLFPFAGDPTTNPWDHAAYNSNLLKADNATMTALGELYASWDADRSVKALTPYMLQNKASMHRLSSGTANSDFPATSALIPSPVSIRVSGAQAQWALLASPVSGQYYIVSLLDGRRLRTDGNTVFLALPGTTGNGVQWQISPESNGYFFINNLGTNTTLFSQRNNDGNGAPTSVTYGVTPSGTPSDNTRFRLVKPVAPTTVPAVTPYTASNLTVTPGDRRAVLSWSGAGTGFTVSRATSASGPFTALATSWPLTTYVDNSAVNGTTYYYNVSAPNLLLGTSAVTSTASALPAANLAVADLEGNYKFEANNAQDNSGNAEHGAAVGGVSYFSPGRVDGMAAHFDGSTGYVQVPGVVANDFSIAYWVRTTSVGGSGTQWYNGSGLVDAEVAGTATDFGTSLLNGKVAFGVGNPDTTIIGSGTVNDGNWHHVVATRAGTTGIMRLYVDGTLQTLGVGPTGTRAAPTGIRLGALQSGGNYFAGDLDEVRFYSYVLATSDVAKLATGSPTALAAQYAFASGNVQDASGQGNHGTANAVTYASPGQGSSVNAAQFDGASSYARLPQSLTNDFTIAFWMKTGTTGGSGAQWYQGAGLIDAEVTGAQADFGTSLLGGKVAFGVGNPDTTVISTTSVNDGQWHHVAATRANGSGVMNLYIDGALQGTTINGPTGSRTAPTALAMGRSLAGGNLYAGQLDDVRLYNYSLTAGQIQGLSNPPPAPYTVQDIGNPAIGGFGTMTSGAWTVGGAGADIWNTGDQFTLVGAPQPGAGTLIARLTAQPVNPDGTTTVNAKAGIMFRDGSSANAAFADVVYDVGQGVQFITRSAASGLAVQSFPNVTGVYAPCWFKLVRGSSGAAGSTGGDYFQAYYSNSTASTPPAASAWTFIGTCTAPMISGNVQAGLAVCSHANGTLDSAGFDNFVFQPNTAPTLSAVANQTVAENTSTAVLGVTVADVESLPAALTLTASSSNPALLPVSNLVFSGTDANRTVQLTPAAYQAGTSTVTLTVSDGQATTTTSFLFTVTTSAAGNWREQYFGTTANSGNAADGANPAGDGITNFFKRAYGLNPLVPATNLAAVLPQVSRSASAGTLNLTYTRAVAANVPDLTFQVLWSSDLINWSSTNVTDGTISANNAAGTETHQASVPLSLGSRLFLELQVTRGN